MPALEIIVGPVEVWLAPVGEPEPDASEAPAANWVLLGKSGSKNRTEDGCTLRKLQTIEADAFRSDGGTGPRRLARTAEDQFVDFTLMDLQAATLAYALTGEASRVTQTPPASGVAGILKQELMRGLAMVYNALLVRSKASAELAGGVTQYYVPECSQVAELELGYMKSDPVKLAFSYRAIEDASAGFGTAAIQDAPPS